MTFHLPFNLLPNPLDQLPPIKKRKSIRRRRARAGAKTPEFPIPTPPELKEWANRNRQVRIALPISDTQQHIVSPYSDEQDPPLFVSSCSMGTPTSSSSDDGPLTPDSDHLRDSHGILGSGYFTSEEKPDTVDNDQDGDDLFFAIGKRSTASTRVPYRSLKTAEQDPTSTGASEKEEAVAAQVKVEKANAKDVKVELVDDKVVKVEEVKVEDVKAEDSRVEEVNEEGVKETMIVGTKIVERPAQQLPPPEWTGGQEWRKVRYIDKETSEAKVTFDIHAWGAARRAAQREEEQARYQDQSEWSLHDESWRDIGRLTSLGMMTYMIYASIPRLHQFTQTGFDIDPVEWTVIGSSFAFFVAAVCGVIC